MAGQEGMAATVGCPRRLSPSRRALRLLTTHVPDVRRSSFRVMVWLFQYMTRHGKPSSGRLVGADVRGFTLRLDPAEFVDAAMLWFPQLYDREELDYVQTHLRPGDVFLDIGAHVGLYALTAARAIGPTGSVLALEAHPDTYRRLRQSLEDNGAANVRALQVGVSDKAGSLRFSVPAPPLRAAGSFVAERGSGIEVDCLPLLDILRQQGVRAVTGAKLDIEGFEYKVLVRFFATAEQSLWPRFIITECHQDMLDQAGGDVLELLTRHGYRVERRLEINAVLVRGS